MPVVNSRVLKTEPQRPGRIRVTDSFDFHTGEVETRTYDVPEGWDTEAHRATHEAFLNANVIRNEQEHVQARVEEGEDPALITVDHITAQQRARAILTALMRGRPHQIIKAAEYVDTNITDVQLDNFVGIARRFKIRDRIAGLLGLKVALAEDEAMRDG